MAERPGLFAEDWNRLNRLLERGLALEAEERASWLATLPRESDHLREILAQLLAKSTATGFSTDTSVADRVGACRSRGGGGDAARSRRRPHRAMAAGAPASRRRHGNRVARTARRRRHAPPGGLEIAARGVDRSRPERAHRARAGDPRAASASIHRGSLRRRAGERGPPVPRSRVRRRSADPHALQGARLDRDATALRAGRARRGLRPLAARHPPRPEAEQCPCHRRRHAEAARLRHLQAHRRRRPSGGRNRAHPPRWPAADALVRGTGTDPRTAGDRGGRRLCARRDAVRAHKRRQAVFRQRRCNCWKPKSCTQTCAVPAMSPPTGREPVLCAAIWMQSSSTP